MGAGPVGLGLAIDLALRDVTSLLIETNTVPVPIPKGQNLTQRSMEHFRAWGIEDDIRRARTMPADYPIAGLTAYENLLSGYTHPWHRRQLVAQFYHCRNERLPQYETERVLRERARSLSNISLRTGWTVDKIHQDAHGASAEIRSADGKQRETIAARYLVGCDGSHSGVRRQAGIPLQTEDHERRMALVLFRSKKLHETLRAFPESSYYNVIAPELEGYWRFFGRIDADERFFFHSPVPVESNTAEFDVHRLLNDAVGADIRAQVDHVGFWDLRFAQARQYRSGNILIAGDAAHSHPPYGGYGINLGLEDARNLSWKIAAQFEGWGTERLIDSYSRERHPVFASTARDFILKYIQADRDFLQRYNPRKNLDEFRQAWSRRVADAETDVFEYVPHYEGSPLVAGKPSAASGARAHHSLRARPGHHIAPGNFPDGTKVIDCLGPGYTLLALGDARDAASVMHRAASELRIPLTVVADEQSELRQRYGATLIVVRPDEYVAWCGDRAPEDVHGLLETISGLGS